VNQPGMYHFIDSDGDEHSLEALNWDDAEITLLKALPPGITLTKSIFKPSPNTAPKPKLEDVRNTRPGPAGTRIAGRRKAHGRNDQCPCGSGKKVKRCCASRSKQ